MDVRKYLPTDPLLENGVPEKLNPNLVTIPQVTLSNSLDPQKFTITIDSPDVIAISPVHRRSTSHRGRTSMIGMRVPPLGLRTTTFRTVRNDDHNIKPSAQFLRDKTVRVFSSIGLLKPHTPGTCIYGQDSAHMETSNLVYNYNTPDRGSPFVATSEVETEEWVITDICLGMAACIAAGISSALWPLLETAVEGKLTW